VISPGPCTPAEAGVSTPGVAQLCGRIPILGVCLGHQCIGAALGAPVVRGRAPVHGKTSRIHHDGRTIFHGLPTPLVGTRYQTLTEAEAHEAMGRIMDGEATAAQIASFITALAMRGETVEEITGFARAIREHAVTIAPQADHLVDIVGTGGDRLNTFNISTT